MKDFLRAIFIAVVVGCASGCASASHSALIGKPAPRYIPFFMLDEEPLILEHLKGRNVVLLFWANSCPQSHKVIDALNLYVQAHGSKKNVVAIAVSIDKADELDRLRDKIVYGKLDAVRHSFSGNDIYDQAKIAFDVGVLPSLYVIDPAGTVVAAGSSMAVVEQVLGE